MSGAMSFSASRRPALGPPLAPGSLSGVFNGDARENVESILESLPPVAIGTTDTVFLIPLTFGARPDWCRNVLAEGECEITLGGVEYLAQDAEICR